MLDPTVSDQFLDLACDVDVCASRGGVEPKLFAEVFHGGVFLMMIFSDDCIIATRSWKANSPRRTLLSGSACYRLVA